MADAALVVNKRLQMLGAEWEDTRAIKDIALLCSGTNVPGAELVDRVQADLAELGIYMLRGHGPEDVIPGLLVRAFWLGFEFGKVEED